MLASWHSARQLNDVYYRAVQIMGGATVPRNSLKYAGFSLVLIIIATKSANGQEQDPNGTTVQDVIAWILMAFDSEWFAGVVGAVLGSVIIFLIQEKLKRRAILNVFNPIDVKSGHRKNSAMVIGLGGSGKTSLINVSGNVLKLGEEVETESYKISHFTTKEQNITYDFYMSDYRGQDFGTQVAAFIQQQLSNRTPMRYGDIESLILVVDLLPPGSKPKDSFNDNRVDEHLSQWNRTALDAVFGMLEQNSLNFVCLFVNKYNMITTRDKNLNKKIKDKFSPLIQDLNKRCKRHDAETGEMVPYARFKLIVGGTIDGTGLPQLRQNLMELSRPMATTSRAAVSNQEA